MRRSESQEQLTPQAERSYEAVSARPEVEFRGERRLVQQPGDITSSSSEMAFDPDLLLIHGCRQIIRLFVPVSLCMFIVVIISCSVPFFSTDFDFFTLDQTSISGGSSDTAGKGVLIALMMMLMIVVMTCIMVLCIKYRCMWFIKGYICVVGVIVLFGLSTTFFLSVSTAMSFFVDYIAFFLFIWNFGVIGMLSFFWKSPLVVQQIYTVFIGVTMALMLNFILPWWTTWFLLGFLAVWDLIAVLCPKGPLRILVELLQKNQDTFPPILVYSTAAGVVFMADAPRSRSPANPSGDNQSNPVQPAAVQPTAIQPEAVAAAAPAEELDDDGGFRGHVANTRRAERVAAANDPAFIDSARARSAMSALNNNANEASNEPPEPVMSETSRNLREIQHEVLSREDRGVKLGLGDFVFYSLLIATAAQSQDWSTILAVFVAILIGMCSTLLLLAIRGHALPALPISIFFGVIFYFSTNLIITPFSNSLAINQAFI